MLAMGMHEQFCWKVARGGSVACKLTTKWAWNAGKVAMIKDFVLQRTWTLPSTSSASKRKGRHFHPNNMTAWLIDFGLQEFLGFHSESIMNLKLWYRKLFDFSDINGCCHREWSICQGACSSFEPSKAWLCEPSTGLGGHGTPLRYLQKCLKGSTNPPDVFKTKVPSSKLAYLAFSSFTSQDENLTDLCLAWLRQWSTWKSWGHWVHEGHGGDASAMFREVFSGSMTSCTVKSQGIELEWICPGFRA